MSKTPANGSGPLHGYRGDATSGALNPCGFVVGISRQAGARGTSIATEVGQRLGWSVYTPEMIDFMARDEEAKQELLKELSPANQLWADYQVQELMTARNLPLESDSLAIARLVYILGLRGQTIIVGRAAGFLLPAVTTLHVRIVAPHTDRVAYMAQWMRLTESEAIDEVKNRDSRRATFMKPFTDRSLDDVTAFDLVLNSSRMSVVAAAELIVLAMQAKQSAATASTESVEAETFG